jgi:hypothetical protein
MITAENADIIGAYKVKLLITCGVEDDASKKY